MLLRKESQACQRGRVRVPVDAEQSASVSDAFREHWASGMFSSDCDGRSDGQVSDRRSPGQARSESGRTHVRYRTAQLPRFVRGQPEI